MPAEIVLKYLQDDADLLITGNTDHGLSRFMHLAAMSESHIGFISDDFPFLSNLTTLENIALGSMFKQNLSLRKIRNMLLPHAKAVGIDTYLDKRKEFLTRDDLIRAHFLRCVASNNSIILLQSPPLSEVQIVFDCIEKVHYKIRVWITCLVKDKASYSEFQLKEVFVEG